MPSIYDNIKTARELVSFVRAHGFSTNIEDICRAQDIFGNTAIEELDDLANDIGRNNEHGEPDPKGTWSSGRIETRSTFYSILFQIWNWEDATHFWHQHSNPDFEELKALRAERKTHGERIQQLTARRDELLKEIKDGGEIIDDITEKSREWQRRAEAAEQEVIALKAKLYDYMTAGGR